jgi:hypothetical protein
MRPWTLVPCLVTLRAEFDAAAPGRDRGSDGSVADSLHSPSSDHTPDEDSDILRDHDPDAKNEVHALDIDADGPWPGGRAWFDRAIRKIVDRHRIGQDDRLEYVIWDRRIASAGIGNWRWRAYHGTADPHTGHAHFSARYTAAQEADTRPYGVREDDDVQLSDKVTLTPTTAAAIGKPTGTEFTVEQMMMYNLLHAGRSSSQSGAALTLLNQLADPEFPQDATVSLLRGLLGTRAKAIGEQLAAG